MNPPTKSYLGDGVYVSIERGMFKLTSENGVSITNEIWLEPEVYEAFKEWAEKAFGYYKDQSKNAGGEV